MILVGGEIRVQDGSRYDTPFIDAVETGHWLGNEVFSVKNHNKTQSGLSYKKEKSRL